jgi:hypothetical protein
LRAKVKFATGRPAAVDAAGGDNGVERGRSVRIVGFRTMARTSSRTSTPAKLVEYAQAAAATSRTRRIQIGAEGPAGAEEFS